MSVLRDSYRLCMMERRTGRRNVDGWRDAWPGMGVEAVRELEMSAKENGLKLECGRDFDIAAAREFSMQNLTRMDVEAPMTGEICGVRYQPSKF